MGGDYKCMTTFYWKSETGRKKFGLDGISLGELTLREISSCARAFQQHSETQGEKDQSQKSAKVS